MAIKKKPRNTPKRPIKIPFVFIYVNLTSALATAGVQNFSFGSGL
jgi:hypothetical protein